MRVKNILQILVIGFLCVSCGSEKKESKKQTSSQTQQVTVSSSSQNYIVNSFQVSSGFYSYQVSPYGDDFLIQLSSDTQSNLQILMSSLSQSAYLLEYYRKLFQGNAPVYQGGGGVVLNTLTIFLKSGSQFRIVNPYAYGSSSQTNDPWYELDYQIRTKI